MLTRYGRGGADRTRDFDDGPRCMENCQIDTLDGNVLKRGAWALSPSWAFDFELPLILSSFL
jgi:hypothetical protein